ncbi:hypothetical protein ASE92_04140 [Pedobacter sp. Leaf41]|uniref:DUF6526 family protein n=1 Tax=Pedobacter sp. Leaf41 TaxID=1736218 RepID=UPI0007025057|nr:DUF6526 family protein [Pedobacter sp. Leaf41]KQN38624.1 hypothetical protein ASE92_04140 [Pedobacter sp. Leaf41]
MSQNYSNHRRFYPLFHFFAVPLILLTLLASLYNCVITPNISSALIFLAIFLVLLTAIMARTFALKAQDRAIRAEEKFRYFLLAGKALPAELTLAHILALRFASDGELVVLVDKVISMQLSPDGIKKEIKSWRGDQHRV